VRIKLISAARFSRARSSRLIAALKSTKVVDPAKPAMRAVTMELMSRAANDLADIIGGIARHEGLPSAPAAMTLALSKRFPAQHDNVTAVAKCVDAEGVPMEGVGVRFAWPLPSGRTVSAVRYTGRDGIARSVRDIGALPWSAQAIVVATSGASGISSVASAPMTPTVALHRGPDGLRTKVSSTRPRRGSTVSMRAYVHSPSGHHLAGVAVLFTWTYRDRTVEGVGYTDSRGIARMRDSIGSAARGRRVRVTAKVVVSRSTRRATSSFVPR
jgi:hypothetical protein